MTIQPNSAVIDLLIAHARLRSEESPDVLPIDSKDSLAIFDELDSLSAEEFALIYALYLLGSGAEEDSERAHCKALAAKFDPLEQMASDANLHVALTQGLKRWPQPDAAQQLLSSG